MKWVKVAIGAVIAIAVLGMLSTQVYSLTQLRDNGEVYKIDFEIIDVTDINDVEYTPLTLYQSLYDMVLEYGSFNPNNNTYFYSYVNYEIRYIVSTEEISYTTIGLGNDNYAFLINNSNIMSEDPTQDNIIPIGTYTIETDIPVMTAQLTGITATLILLTPLIFAGGVLAYLLNKQNY